MIKKLLGYGAAFPLLTLAALAACSGRVQPLGDAASGTAGSGGAAQGRGGGKPGTGAGGTSVGAGGTSVGAGGTSVGAGGTLVGAGGTLVGTGGKDSGPRAGSGSAAGPGDPPPGPLSCMSDADCPGSGEPCQTCADGHTICSPVFCDGRTGTCKVSGGYCAVGCATNADCPVSNLPCTDCGNGAEACPTTECQAGFCEISYPGCSDHDPCGGKGCGEECQSCQGTGCTVSVTAYCNPAGKCQPGPPTCEPRCLAQEDCGEPADCTSCPDVGGTCARYVCRSNGLCQLTCTPSAGKTCQVSSDCPAPAPQQCVKCVDGSCAIPACLDDACKWVCLAN